MPPVCSTSCHERLVQSYVWLFHGPVRNDLVNLRHQLAGLAHGEDDFLVMGNIIIA